jgi:hypothetical protein
MIYDQDALWAELDKLPLEDVRKRLNQGVYAPAAKAKLVAIYIEQKDAGAERAAREIPELAKLDGDGRDVAELKSEFRRQLEEVGAPRVRLWYAQSKRLDAPEKYMWMEEWVAEQNAADADRDRQLQRDRDARVDEHNRRTRQIAFGALILSGLSAVIASLTWIFPKQPPPVIVPPASVTFTAPSTSSVLPRSAQGDDAKTNSTTELPSAKKP